MTTPSIHAGGSHDLKPVPTATLAHYAAPSPTPRSRSPKLAVTMPKRSVTINRDGRSRWTEMTGHVRRNTHQDALDAAFLAHPQRFKDRRPRPHALPTAAWINPPKQESLTAAINTPPCAVN